MVEAANKRIAEIHARKASEATKAVNAIEKAQEKTEKNKQAASTRRERQLIRLSRSMLIKLLPEEYQNS